MQPAQGGEHDQQIEPVVVALEDAQGGVHAERLGRRPPPAGDTVADTQPADDAGILPGPVLAPATGGRGVADLRGDGARRIVGAVVGPAEDVDAPPQALFEFAFAAFEVAAHPRGIRLVALQASIRIPGPGGQGGAFSRTGVPKGTNAGVAARYQPAFEPAITRHCTQARRRQFSADRLATTRGPVSTQP